VALFAALDNVLAEDTVLEDTLLQKVELTRFERLCELVVDQHRRLPGHVERSVEHKRLVRSVLNSNRCKAGRNEILSHALELESWVIRVDAALRSRMVLLSVQVKVLLLGSLPNMLPQTLLFDAELFLALIQVDWSVL